MDEFRPVDLYVRWHRELVHTDAAILGGGWVNSTFTTYTYDGSGNELGVLSQTWSGGQWTNAFRSTNTLDARGKPVTVLTVYWSNGQWTNSERETYTYDANELALSHLIEKWQNAKWTNWTLDLFTYDTHGNQLSGTNARWSNSSWVPMDATFQVFFYSDSNTYYFTGDTIRISYTLLNISAVSPQASGIADGYSLYQNYPNPFNPGTTVTYVVPKASNVTLRMYNSLGQLVATLVDRNEQAGSHEIKVDGSHLASGVYVYRIQAGSFVQSKKMILLR